MTIRANTRKKQIIGYTVSGVYNEGHMEIVYKDADDAGCESINKEGCKIFVSGTPAQLAKFVENWNREEVFETKDNEFELGSEVRLKSWDELVEEFALVRDEDDKSDWEYHESTNTNSFKNDWGLRIPKAFSNICGKVYVVESFNPYTDEYKISITDAFCDRTSTHLPSQFFEAA